jgi:hypothetical protein
MEVLGEKPVAVPQAVCRYPKTRLCCFHKCSALKELPACFTLSHLKIKDRRKKARKHLALLPSVGALCNHS